MKEFKIVNPRTGTVMMRTTDPECVYSDDVIKRMINAGYKAYMDGRVYRPGKKATVKKLKTDNFGQMMLF